MSVAEVPTAGIYGAVTFEGRLCTHPGDVRTGEYWAIWHTKARQSSKIDTYGNRVLIWIADLPWQGRPVLDLDNEVMASWRHWRFAEPSVSTVPFGMEALRTVINPRIWWSSSRKNAKNRAALYMPAMPRQDLINLAHNLEADSACGVKTVRKEKIGVWIKRIWAIIEARERGVTSDWSTL